jgi:small subunit ribosomal protein S16
MLPAIILAQSCFLLINHYLCAPNHLFINRGFEPHIVKSIMATRIRLQRHGKKSKAFFHIVAADSRAKRDGKFIEKIGTYNPNTNPATIDINFDAALKWVQVGAEMTDTARAIMSYKGVLYKNHLLNGVKKGALTADQVEAKFNQWLADKDAKITGKQDNLAKNAAADKAARMKAEADANAAKAKAIEEKNTPEVEEVAVEEVATEEAATEVEESTEVVAEEAPAEEPATEETPEEVPAPAEEPATETPEEVPATEEAAPEAPAADEASESTEETTEA